MLSEPFGFVTYILELPERFLDLLWRHVEPTVASVVLGVAVALPLAVLASRVAALGVRTISDLKGKARSLTFGGTQEFITRPDGLPGIQKAYGLKFKQARGMDFGITYQAVATGQVDVISGFATDGRIPALKLVTLEDDKRFFPPYFAAPVVRQDTLAKDGRIAEAIDKLAGRIDNETMAGLNLQVDQEKTEAADVARAFLERQGLID